VGHIEGWERASDEYTAGIRLGEQYFNSTRIAPNLAHVLGESYTSSEKALKELMDNEWDVEAIRPNLMSYADQGFSRGTSSGKSDVFRVTMVRLCWRAVAASRLSMSGSLRPARWCLA
jgi:hypothetical protein